MTKQAYTEVKDDFNGVIDTLLFLFKEQGLKLEDSFRVRILLEEEIDSCDEALWQSQDIYDSFVKYIMSKEKKIGNMPLKTSILTGEPVHYETSKAVFGDGKSKIVAKSIFLKNLYDGLDISNNIFCQ